MVNYEHKELNMRYREKIAAIKRLEKETYGRWGKTEEGRNNPEEATRLEGKMKLKAWRFPGESKVRWVIDTTKRGIESIHMEGEIIDDYDRFSLYETWKAIRIREGKSELEDSRNM